MVVLGLIYILSGSPSFELPAQPIAASTPTAEASTASEGQTDSVQEEEITPTPVSAKTISLKERKAAKILAAQEAQRAAMAATSGDKDEAMDALPIVEVETVLVADEYLNPYLDQKAEGTREFLRQGSSFQTSDVPGPHVKDSKQYIFSCEKTTPNEFQIENCYPQT